MPRQVLRVAWMPAFAGMTLAVRDALSTFAIPAKAGIHAILRLCTSRCEASNLMRAPRAPVSLIFDRT